MKSTFGLYIILGMAFVFLGSCSSNTEVVPDGKKFFDADDYFKKEIERLTANKDSVSKLLSIDGKIDVIISMVDFEKELDAFVKSNINKSDLYDKYEVDSTYEKGLLRQENYAAMDSTLWTRSFKVGYDSLGKVSQIDIKNIRENPILKSVQSLSYKPDTLYGIVGYTKTLLNDEGKTRIEVNLINRKP